MPGGLTDAEFQQDPQQSLRTRNWLESPWNIIALKANYKVSKHTTINLTSSYLFSQRNLIWRNEDGWPNEADSIIPSFTYVPRELEREYFNSITNELRVLTNYRLGNNNSTLAFGIRQAYSLLKRREGADGSTGSDYDLTQYSPYTTSMNFGTNNIAPFAENIFHIGKKLSITPGIRFEYLSTTANGYIENGDSLSATIPFLYSNKQRSTRTFLLGGIGAQYDLTNRVNAYANFSQSYRPITYSDLTPFGSIAKIDPNLKDSKGDDGDLGIRGVIKNMVNFDISAFYLTTINQIGIVDGTDGNPYRTNTGTSVHTGLETYVELNLSDLLFHNNRIGKISIYNSLAYVNAKYTEGAYKGNQVEYAPHVVERVGINYWIKGFSFNAQYSYQSKSFGDASNVVFSPDALVGIIPAYYVADISAGYKWKNYELKFGVNNLTDGKYFTLRTSEYPGPGIIPAIGRMVYGGISATF